MSSKLLIFWVIYLFIINLIRAQDVRLKGSKPTQKSNEEKKEKANITVSYSIYGKIIDAQTSESLPGVKILIKEKPELGTLTDLNGNFSLKDLEPQNYTLQVQYIGYQTKEIQEVNPKNLKEALVITLKETGVELQEVVIQSNVRKESEASAILLQKINMGVLDVFSGDVILRTTSDLFVNTALSRMPGISVVEDRYLIVRGMPERYNTVLLNGGLMPILHADKQTFDFNNLPSNMISQIQLVKSFSSEIPGGFGGGVIRFETPDMPEQNQTVFNYQINYNPNISLQNEYLPKMNNKSGKIGIFSSPVSFLPENFPDAQTIQNIPIHSDENAFYAKQINSDFHATPQFIRPNQSFAFQIKRRYAFSDKLSMGFSAATNFSEIFSQERTSFKFFEDFNPDLGYNPVSDTGNLTINKNNQTFNQILNLNFISKKFQVHFKNYLSQNQWNAFSDNNGDFHYIDIDNNKDVWYSYKYWLNRFEKQQIYSSQLSNEWILQQNNHSENKIQAQFFFNRSQYQIPLNYPLYSEWDENDQIYRLTPEYLENFYDLIFATNSLQKQKDKMWGINLQWNYRKQFSNWNCKFLAGTFFMQQHRTFNSRFIGIIPARQDSIQMDLNRYPVEPYHFTFSPELIKPYHFILKDITTDSSNYSASALNIAPYFQTQFLFNNQWSFHAGLRFEFYKPSIINHALDGSDSTLNNKTQTDLLFNAGIGYQLTENMKLKLLYSSTLVRPDFRELSKMEYFDYYQSIFWAGNSQLQKTNIQHFDLRYEWFNQSNSLFSATLFYKKLKNPMEQTLRQGELVYVMVYELNNAKDAFNLGFELEARQQLAQSGYLQNLKFYGNIMLQSSQVNDDRTGRTQRPLQGQSPYLINAGILFYEPKSQINLDIFYNHFGKQIVIVGTPEKFNNLYLLPRHKIDIQLSRAIGKWNIKLAIQDILNQPYIRRQYYDIGFYQDNKYTRLATIYSLALQYKF